MCGPLLAIASFAASAVGKIVEFGAAQADYDAKAEAWKQNYLNALAGARDEQKAITLRQTQEEAAAGQKVELADMDEAQHKAAVEVSAAEGGVSGVSVDNLVREQGAAAAFNRASITENLKMKTAQLQSEKDATNTTALNRINSMQRPTAPSGAALAVGIIGSGVKAFGSM